ncbi:hypothetical protein DPMN_170295 [Dreissena polymorpha]|uniref:G-protein coupled receptors family 1 profile domain-containing protein n=1 Tax=Dreissena polymorpha TaxID=45954 RepID=A0A9D4DXK2_DREPO|nr:hypothetical protein DPMN_170295 [Dreissena polymorpha]
MEINSSNVNQSGIIQHDLSGSYVAISVLCLLMATVIIPLNGLVIFILGRQKDNNRLHFFIFHLSIAEYRPYKAIFIGSWVMALLIPVWTFSYTGTVLYETIYYCDITITTELGWKLYVGFTLLVVFFIPFLAVFYCYIGITVVIWKHWRESRQLSEMNYIFEDLTLKPCHETKNSGLLPKARIKSIQMTLIMCFAFLICWLPATAFHILDVYQIDVLDVRYYIVLQRLYPLNSACNPVIFLFFSRNILPCGSPKSSETTRGYESDVTTNTTT